MARRLQRLCVCVSVGQQSPGLIRIRYIFAGGLSYELTEGDIVCIFSQYGEILDINLIRDKQTGKSKGFAYLRYEDQRSTILAVDNLSGAKVLGRSLRVDHVSEYKQPIKKGDNAEDWNQDPRISMNVAPVALLSEEQRIGLDEIDGAQKVQEAKEDYTKGLDPEDPMFDYLVEQRRAIGLAEAEADSTKRHRNSSGRREHRHRTRRHRSRSPESQRPKHEDAERHGRRHHRASSKIGSDILMRIRLKE